MSKLELLNIREAFHKIVFNTLLVHRRRRWLFFLFDIHQCWTLEELAQALIKHGFAESRAMNKDGTVASLVFKNGIDLSAIEAALMSPEQLKIAREYAPKRDKVS